jgi:hypothetical protein
VLLIVGHGPSVLSGLGAVIDQCTVVRLKNGLNVRPKPDPLHWGTRTDYTCGRSLVFRDEKHPEKFWHFDDPPEWIGYYESFRPRHKKPSTGLCAVFCAIDRLAPEEIALIGFDRLLDPNDMKSRKATDDQKYMYSMYGHDQRAEHECLMSLPVKIIDFRKHCEAKEEA